MHITPAPENIIIKAKYFSSKRDLNSLKENIKNGLLSDLPYWEIFSEDLAYVKFSLDITKVYESGLKGSGEPEERVTYFNALRNLDSSKPSDIDVRLEPTDYGIEIFVEIFPIMYRQISQLKKNRFTSHEIERVHIEARRLLDRVFIGAVGCREIESPYPISSVFTKAEEVNRLHKLFEEFRGLTNFSPGEKIWLESSEKWYALRKRAKERYAKIFDPKNILKMSKEDFKSFLYFKNNYAWTNLYRRGLEATESINELRKAIVLLQDESIDIKERINSVLRGRYKVRGVGKNIATAILHTCDKQDRYGVWNSVTVEALKVLDRSPRIAWNYGAYYSELNEKLIELKKELKTDLVMVDGFLWFIVNRTKLLGLPSYKPKKEMKYKEKPVRKPTPNEILSNLENSLRKFIETKLRDIEGKNWWKSRVPVDIQNNCRERKREREKARPWEEVQEWPLIYYADFLDYMKIILRRDNWKEVFRKYFREKYFVESRFRDLNPIRTDLAHNRPLTEKQIQALEKYSKEILKCIEL